MELHPPLNFCLALTRQEGKIAIERKKEEKCLSGKFPYPSLDTHPLTHTHTTGWQHVSLELSKYSHTQASMLLLHTAPSHRFLNSRSHTTHTQLTPYPGAFEKPRASVSRLLTSVSWPASNAPAFRAQPTTVSHKRSRAHTHCFFFISKGSGAGNLPLPPSYGVRLDPSPAYTSPVNKQHEKGAQYTVTLIQHSHTHTHTHKCSCPHTHAPSTSRKARERTPKAHRPADDAPNLFGAGARNSTAGSREQHRV